MKLEKILQADEWLGHPLHPALVAGPLGLWSFSLIMDMVAAVSKNKCIQEAADSAVTGGLVVSGIAAATGLAEYTRLSPDDPSRETAFTHGSLNAMGVALYGVNAMIRRGRYRAGKPGGCLPKLLSVLGMGVVTYTGWLGGGMVYNGGVAVDRQRHERQEQQPRPQRPRTRAASASQAQVEEEEAKAHA